MQQRTPADLLADGYFLVPAELWGRLHAGDVISYTRLNSPGKSYGGKIVGVFSVDDTTKLKIRSERKPVEWCESLLELEEVWKRYARGSEIEFSMIMFSLAEKNKKLEEAFAEIRYLKEKLGEGPFRPR